MSAALAAAPAALACLPADRLLCSVSSAGRAPLLLSPACREAGKWEEAYLGLPAEEGHAEARQAAAFAACRACHSGGASNPVLCDSSECPVTYSRLACSSRLQQLGKQLRRLDHQTR